jgi:hypothetical protein
MSIYKEASRIKLRVNTGMGQLSVEQLWDLSLTKLSTIIRNVKTSLQKDNDDELSFLDETKKVDPVQQLIFDILKDIYLTKKNELVAEKEEAARKAHNDKINELLFKKQESKLESLSEEELRKLLK